MKTLLEIKNLIYVICFVVPHLWGTMAQMLGYSETHLFPNNCIMFIFRIGFVRYKQKA
jgi:hypothetical protein